jgi:hypothetical protein
MQILWSGCSYIPRTQLRTHIQDGLGRTTQTLDHVVVVHVLIWDKRKSQINEYSDMTIWHAQIHLKAIGFGGWRNAYAETMWNRYCKKSGGTPPEKLLRERFRVCMVWNDIVIFSGSPPDRLLSLRSLQLWQSDKKLTFFFFNKKNLKKKSTYLLHHDNHYRTSRKKHPDPDLGLTQLLDDLPAQGQ